MSNTFTCAVKFDAFNVELSISSPLVLCGALRSQKALGGNSRAAVLVAVHPSSLYLDTSFSTLRFAMKCKEIKKKVCANFFSPEQSLIAQQKKLIAM